MTLGALVDGRAFSCAADDDRTNSVRRIVNALRIAGVNVGLLLFDGCKLSSDDPLLRGVELRHAPFSVASPSTDVHPFTHYLSQILAAGGFDLYVDASPDLAPARIEVVTAATLAVVVDRTFTDPPASAGELRHWQNAILRIDRADGLLVAGNAIPERVSRYFGRHDHTIFHLQDEVNSEALAAFAAAAVSRHGAGVDATQIQVFSSLPGEFCGVADYTVGHLRAHAGESALYFSHGDPGVVAKLRARLFSYLDFSLAAEWMHSPRLFHVATSLPLLAGLKLLRRESRTGDIAVIHERRYFDGFRHVMTLDGSRDGLALEFFPQGREATELARRTLDFVTADAPRGPMASWLAHLPTKLVSLLSPQVQAAAASHREKDGSPARNDFSNLENNISYVPLGIDDRSGPHLSRAARRLRSSHGVPVDALVVGHFGVIVDGHKLLNEATNALLKIGQKFEWQLKGRDLYLVLCGKRLDRALATSISNAFSAVGRRDRLRFANPAPEEDFEVEMAACDVTFCLRVQSYGQQSHARVRAMSLGVPTIVNRASGWSYDPATTLEDDRLQSDMERVLTEVADGGREAMSRAARHHYESVHRADITLVQLIEKGRADAGA